MKKILLFAILLASFLGTKATTYYSITSGGTVVGTFRANRDGTGATPANFSTSGDIFIIQGTGGGSGAPHTVTSGSTVTFGAGITIEVEGGATLVQNSNITFNATATFKLDANSFYTHNTSSSAATVAGIESWASSATIKYTNTGFLPTANITGGAHPNVIVANASNANIAGVITNIAGNLTIQAGAANTINLTGATALTLTIGGDLILTTGTALSLGNGTATPIVNIGGNISIATGMTLTYAGSGAQGTINFTKSGTQTFSTAGTGVTAGAINYTVNNGSTLDVGTSLVKGTGTFTVASGGGIITANTAGLSTTAATGSFQVTGTKTYNTAGNYTFNAGSSQVTGNGLTGANNLTINNSSGVTLTSATSVTGTLALTNGAFTNGANLSMASSSTISRANGTLGTVPTFTGSNVNVTYTGSTSDITTGNEMPAAGATLKTLTINQASNSVILGANVDVNTSLALTAGVVVSNGNTITLKGSGSTITGSTVFGTAYTSYVATCDNSNTPSSAGGLVIENIGTSGRTGDILFPVGPTKTSYNPVVVNNSSANIAFTARVNTTAISGITPSTVSVQRTWNVSPASGSPSAVLKMQWLTADEGGTFVRATSKVVHYNGSTADVLSSATAASGSNPWNVSSGATSFTSYGEFGITSGSIGSANIALADNSQVTVANVLVGSNNHILSRFILTNSGSLDAALNTVNFTTTGTYVAADIANLRFWYNTSNDFSTATQLAALTSSLGSGSKSFTGLTQNIAQGGSPVYCWITTSIAGAATTTNTIAISAIANADITFSGGSKSGSVTAAGAQTFVDGVDGVISTSPSNEYGDHTNGGNQQQSGTPITYMRWTDDKLYVGVSAANLAEGFVLYLDKNPQTPVNGGTNANGTNVGFNYDGTNFAELPFRADLVLYVKSGYREFRTADGSNGWTSATSSFGEYAENGGTSTREFSIPWSVIGGKPSAFNWFGYITSSGGYVYAQTPTENADAFIGTSARYGRYYTVSSTSSTKPFSQNSYVFNSTSDLTGFGAISVYDFTMNTNGKFISRSNSASGAWNIAGNLVVNNGTIYMGASGGSGYGATTVTGNVNVSGGLLDMDYNTNALTVNTDVNLSGSGTLALSNSVGGDLKLKGNWSKTGGTFTPRIRLVEFNGTAAQTLTGSSTFDYFKVDNTNGLTLVSANPTTVNTNITLTAGSKLTIGASDLVFGGVNADLSTGSTNYIVTNSTGQFKRTVGVTATNFPVGNSSYNPLTITNSGTSDIYGIRVVDGAITTTSPNNITKTIDRLWKITEANAGGSILSIAASYNDAEKNNATNFDAATTPRIGLYNGSTWSQVTATGTNTFTASSTLTPSDLTTAQSIALGKDDGFIAFPPEIVLADNGTQVAAANIGKNTTNNIIYKLQLSVTINDATLNSVAFTTTGSYVASSDITNFKLHYSSTNDFSTASPIGSTLTSSLDAGAHTFSGLSQSITATTTGYLWITTDIKSTAIVNNTIAVSAITTSDITVVLGNKTGTTSAGGVQTIKQFTTATDAFRSAITGNWNDVATWESFSGGSWIAATLTPDASASTITILTGDTLTVTANVSIDETTVDAGGQVNINSGVTLTVADGTATDLTVNGYLNNTGTLTTTGATVSVSGSSATYEHSQNNLTIPANITWASSSTLKLTGVFAGPGTAGTTLASLSAGNYQNIIWAGAVNCVATTDIDFISFGNNTVNIAGKLTASATGNGAMIVAVAANPVLTAASYEQTSGIVYVNRNANDRTLSITGDATITGGTLYLKLSGNAATGRLVVKGNLTVGSFGTITSIGSAGVGTIRFDGTNPQIWSHAGTFSATTNGIAVIDSSAGGVTLNTDVTLPLNSSLSLPTGDFTVVSGQNLTLAGTSTLTIGAGRTLQVNGTLTHSASGTVTTTGGTLNIGNGAKYIHNRGTATLVTGTWSSGSTCEIQNIGGGTTFAFGGQTLHHLIWNNSTQAGSVQLTSSLAGVNGNLEIQNCGNTSARYFRLTNAASYSLAIGGNLDISASNGFAGLDIGNSSGTNAILTIGGNISIGSSGSLVSTPTGATIRVAGNWSNTGTFTSSNTTVTFNGTIAQSITKAGGESFNNFSVTNTAATVTAANNVTVGGSFTTSASSILDMGTNTLSVATVSHSGTLQTQNTGATPITASKTWGGTVEYNGSSAQSVVAGTYNNLTVSTSGSKTMTGNVITSGILNLNAVNLTTNASNLTINGSLTGSGTITSDDFADITIGGSGSLGSNLTFTAGARTCLDLTINRSGQTITLGSPILINDFLNLTAGTLDDNGNTITVVATDIPHTAITGTGTHSGSGKISITGTGSTISGATLGNIDIASSSISLSGSPTINGTLTLTSTNGLDLGSSGKTLTIASAGVVEAANNQLTGTGTVTMNGTFKTTNTNGFSGASSSIPSATVNLGSTSTVEYNATVAQIFSERTDYRNVILAGNATKTLNGNSTVLSALTLTNAADKLSIAANTLTLNGTITGSGVLVGSSSSNLSITGTSSFGTINFDQTTDGTTNILNDVIVNRITSGTLSLGNKLVILNSYTPTAGVLTTGGFLHLRSTPSNTARVAPGDALGDYITGNVTVERYVAASAKRAWRLITPGVTTSTTINANWQEGKQNTVINLLAELIS